MPDTEIGNIDYTTIDVDKHVTYDSLEGRVVIITGGGQGPWPRNDVRNTSVTSAFSKCERLTRNSL